MKNKSMKIIKPLLSTALLFGLTVGTANAATSGTTDAQVTVTSGSLSINNVVASVNLGTIVVDGTIKNATGNLNTVTVSDQRGTGDGWNLTVSASQFTQTGAVATPLRLDTNTFTLQGIASITQTAGTGTAPTISGTFPKAIDSGAVKIVSAAPGAGMGSFDIAFPANALKLSVDTSKKVVDASNSPTIYDSTITWQLNVGP